jgi:hypothetical protein
MDLIDNRQHLGPVAAALTDFENIVDYDTHAHESKPARFVNIMKLHVSVNMPHAVGT